MPTLTEDLATTQLLLQKVEELQRPLETLLVRRGVNPALTELLLRLGLGIAALALAYLAYILTRRYLTRLLQRLLSRSPLRWAAALFEQKVFRWLSHLAPALVIYLLGPLVLARLPLLPAIVSHGAQIYMILSVTLMISGLLDTLHAIYQTKPIAQQQPIKGYLQAAKIALFFLAGVLILSGLVGQTPLYILSGLGALTAILLLVFRDSILGFVASIQFATNDLVRVGDWIEMAKYGADGDVIDISITAVKVQNWDKTITSIPTYALVNDSFKNWRGMQATGSRRIKRALYIDMTTIRFCDRAMIGRLEKIQLIADYVKRRRAEIEAWNAAHGVDETLVINGRQMTNLGTFRAYIEAYLRHNPLINQSLTLMVRQLDPTPQGLPLEVYCFSADPNWVRYEGIQADIFDHLLAAAAQFDLGVYQNPSGRDLRQAAQDIGATRA